MSTGFVCGESAFCPATPSGSPMRTVAVGSRGGGSDICGVEVTGAFADTGVAFSRFVGRCLRLTGLLSAMVTIYGPRKPSSSHQTRTELGESIACMTWAGFWATSIIKGLSGAPCNL